MIKDYSIETAAGALFSTGCLSEKILAAQELMRMPGHAMFQTAVPWRIIVTHDNNDDIIGLSENLSLAACDIHAQLMLLAKISPADRPVTITIDEARLA